LSKKVFLKEKIILIKHSKGAFGLRQFGLGPNLLPCKGLTKLKTFLDQNTTWAKNRRIGDIKKCLANSDVIISIWSNNKILGFGRALSDGIYRSVLWDIVIDSNHQGKGYGKLVVKSLLESEKIKKSERIYLMTSNRKDFYCQLNFKEVQSQDLLIRDYSNASPNTRYFEQR
tara:strand:+ start:439 stop:954 length:516 start_codon:yes stop_codon:yes gene_type:complete